ncbi:helix-turn-helix domain-containing protein [Nonomuraea glycinis]|jgi:excisionase family DNA binding protein|uniref:helix-turn-helix domain-containing protein n=1 Tax=Nonomuraea glycinis TaxID=2047744 RepID=UPI002E0D13A3|nr:helix-turn-helix domain-containing protein [Nonomuraea glycinis]
MADDVQLYRGPDAMLKLRMSRSVIYEQLRSGRLRSVKQGRCRLIPASALREYITLLHTAAVIALVGVALGFLITAVVLAIEDLNRH